MQPGPSPELHQRLRQLGIASPAAPRGLTAHIGRLAHAQPSGDAAWIENLVRQGRLTRYQALVLLAGGNDPLRVGPYLIRYESGREALVGWYRAVGDDGREVRLAVAPRAVLAPFADRNLDDLVERSVRLPSEATVAGLLAWGVDGEQAWFACRDAPGRSLLATIATQGRLSSQKAWRIGYQLAIALEACEQSGIVHGDLSVRNVWLTPCGHVHLVLPGWRVACWPDEDLRAPGLPAALYDNMPPERVTNGAAPDRAGDLFGWGCLLWHLIEGQPLFSGATPAARLSAQARWLARGTPPIEGKALQPECEARWQRACPAPLAAAVTACLQPVPTDRPASWAALRTLLGSPTAGCKPSARGGQLSNPTWMANRAGAHYALGWPRKGTLMTVVACLVILLAGGRAILKRARPVAAPAQATIASATLPTTAAANHPPAIIQEEEASDSDAWKSDASERNLAEHNATSGVRIDPQVSPAAAEARLAEIVLPAGPQAFDFSRLEDGQLIRSRPSERATVEIPPEGVVIAAEGLHFVDIDFVAVPANRSATRRTGGSTASRDESPWPGNQNRPGDKTAALMVFTRSEIAFEGCILQGAPGTRDAAALRLEPRIAELPATRHQATLPGLVEYPLVRLVGCVTRSLGAVVNSSQPFHIEAEQSLCLGPGVLVDLELAEDADQPVRLDLTRVTLRGGSGLAALHGQAWIRPGVAIQADNCALILSRVGSMFRLSDLPPPRGLASLQWSGQGTVMGPAVPWAAVAVSGGRLAALPEEQLEVSGVVRTEVGFADSADLRPAASQVVRWQVPLTSSDPPGASELPAAFPGESGRF